MRYEKLQLTPYTRIKGSHGADPFWSHFSNSEPILGLFWRISVIFNPRNVFFPALSYEKPSLRHPRIPHITFPYI